jgi:hypothetical protein
MNFHGELRLSHNVCSGRFSHYNTILDLATEVVLFDKIGWPIAASLIESESGSVGSHEAGMGASGFKTRQL